MIVKDWKKQNPDADYTIVWAADTNGGFGKKGWTVYGNCDYCEIISVRELENSWAHFELSVWNPAWGTIEKGDNDEA